MMRWMGVALSAALLLTVSGCSGSRPSETVDSPPIEQEQVRSETSSEPGPFITTATGLKYRILRPSDGRKPRISDSVLVHYHGWLDDGTVFDTTHRENKPARFPVDGVVPGFAEGLQKIGEGGVIELEIPSRLGYGSRGAGDKVPPNATLHFRVELLAIQ